VEALLAIADEIMAEYSAHPRVAAFWRPRFERFAHWFAETEGARRRNITKMFSEISGILKFEAPAGEFALTGRADRIDFDDSGRLILYDYKTGALPANSAVVSLRAPQLPLEAAIARSGGFAEVGAHPVSSLRYISASGGDPAGEQRTIKTASAEELAEQALDGLKGLVARYDDASAPYRAARRSGFDYRYDVYAQLARAEEWAVLAAAEG